MLVFILAFSLGIFATFVTSYFSIEQNREDFICKINKILKLRK